MFIYMKKVTVLACTCFLVSTLLLFWYNKEIVNKKNCIKTSQNQTYKICKTLPYSEIECGLPTTKTSPDGKEYVVPNRAFFIWFYKEEHEFKFYNYLALRSVASVQRPEEIVFYYSDTLPTGEHWERAIREIPCLKLEKIDEPAKIGDVQLPDPVRKTDVARLQLLIETGGTYIDGDVITVNSFDPLRIYPATLGRSIERNVCICVVFARKGSLFLKQYYDAFPRHFRSYRPSFTATTFLKMFIENVTVKVHVEETSINRPSPHVKADGVLSTTLDRVDLSDNYFLHIHPKKVSLKTTAWQTLKDEELRTLDGTYGDAARIALFGSPDLVFKPGESVFEMKPKRKVKTFQPIVQRNAVIEDVDNN